jgi:hypothetical protein
MAASLRGQILCLKGRKIFPQPRRAPDADFPAIKLFFKRDIARKQEAEMKAYALESVGEKSHLICLYS